MNEIIQTIITGLPQTALVVLFIGSAVIYGFILDRALESKHDILTGFVLAFGVFICCMGLSYFFGSII
jgi:hypothetical protein